jgi:hypothetical protein
LFKHFIIFTVILLSLTSCGIKNSKVYYIPLDVDLYGYPTPEEIMKYGVEMDFPSNSIEKLFEDITDINVLETIDLTSQNLRIKIIRKEDGKTIWINQNKKVFSENKSYKIDEEVVNLALKDIIEHSKQYKKWQL